MAIKVANSSLFLRLFLACSLVGRALAAPFAEGQSNEIALLESRPTIEIRITTIAVAVKLPIGQLRNVDGLSHRWDAAVPWMSAGANVPFCLLSQAIGVNENYI